MMAGSYLHCVNAQGKLIDSFKLMNMIEPGGDVYEAVEEMYGMIWLLAEGNAVRVEAARQNYEAGLALSPGLEKENRI